MLNGMYYNGQFGWMAMGPLWQPPAGTKVWIEALQSDPGLSVYQTGTYAPIFGTGASSARWAWNQIMTHNWYAASVPGVYSSTYSVYIGDATTGEPIAGFGPAQLTLSWELLVACTADCDMNGVLSIFDYICFSNAFAAGMPFGDCDASGTLNVFDYICFGNNYSLGCP